MAEHLRYSDLDMGMNINPNTGDFVVKKNDAAIRQHIRLLFVGSGLPFKPESRNGISLRLFDSWNSHSKFIIETRIREHVRVYENRIDVREVLIEFNETTRNLSINLIYVFKEEETELNFSFVISSIR